MKKVTKLLQIMNESKKPTAKNQGHPGGLIFFRGDKVTMSSLVKIDELMTTRDRDIKVTTLNYIRDDKAIISVDASILPVLSGLFGAYNNNDAIRALSTFDAGQTRYLKKPVLDALKRYSLS
jgi:hypothetical protein